MKGTEKARYEWLARKGKPTPCPYCGSEETERYGIFGEFHIAEPYICKVCHSPFSRIKWETAPAEDE